MVVLHELNITYDTPAVNVLSRSSRHYNYRSAFVLLLVLFRLVRVVRRLDIRRSCLSHELSETRALKLAFPIFRFLDNDR